MNNAALYCRISHEKNETSISKQINILKQYVKTNKGTVVDIYSERKSGKHQENRDAWNRLINAIELGINKFDSVIALESSRIARNVDDARAIRRYFKNNNIELIVLNRPVDDGTPTSKLINTILDAVDEYESDITSYRRKQTNAEKKARGEHIGKGFRAIEYESWLLAKEISPNNLQQRAKLLHVSPKNLKKYEEEMI